MVNHSPIPGLRSRRLSMESFDRLPRRVKELIWDLPFSATVDPGTMYIPQSVVDNALEAFYRSTAQVYGPDHPQAIVGKKVDLEIDF